LPDIRADVDDITETFPVARREQPEPSNFREVDQPFAAPKIGKRNLAAKLAELPPVSHHFDGAEREQILQQLASSFHQP
jgi:hypothetical protein